MSRFLIKSTSVSQSMLLVVSAKQLAWLDPRSPTQWQFQALDSGADMASAIRLWTAIAESCHKTKLAVGVARVIVCLAPELTHHWLQIPPLQTQSLKELHAISSARANALFSQPEGCRQWCISADWNANQAFLCTAVSPPVVGLLSAISNSQKKTDTVSLLPLVLQKLKHLFPSDGWMAIVLADRFYLLQREQGVNVSMRTSRLPGPPSASCEVLVLQEWQREMLRTQKYTENLYCLDATPGPHQAIPPAQRSQTLPSQLITLRWTSRTQAPTLPYANTDQHNALACAWLTGELMGAGYAF